MRLVDAIGGEADERAALKRRRVVRDDRPLADVVEQLTRQRIAAVP
jgi:ferric-dicitrate binding protein FerR (iron transport regulator)